MHKFEFINIYAKCSDFNFVDQYIFSVIYYVKGQLVCTAAILTGKNILDLVVLLLSSQHKKKQKISYIKLLVPLGLQR